MAAMCGRPRRSLVVRPPVATGWRFYRGPRVLQAKTGFGAGPFPLECPPRCRIAPLASAESYGLPPHHGDKPALNANNPGRRSIAGPGPITLSLPIIGWLSGPSSPVTRPPARGHDTQVRRQPRGEPLSGAARRETGGEWQMRGDGTPARCGWSGARVGFRGRAAIGPRRRCEPPRRFPGRFEELVSVGKRARNSASPHTTYTKAGAQLSGMRRRHASGGFRAATLRARY
jgi:hypothetical protein